MNVKNRRCIRHLSFKQMKAGRSRNLIAIFAIALTTLLFTSLFTIVLSINSSYKEYSFRQVGGYAHGSFKEVDEEQIAALSGHKKVKEYGLRTVCGVATDAPFSKVSAEISWMDANTTKWSYAMPTTGRMPESGMEIAMDTTALQLLGIEPELGAQVELTYQEGNGLESDPEHTDIFTLVGFWDYDELMPVHYINVTKDYIAQVEADYVSSGGESFRTDMNVMLTSSWNIRSTMEQIDTDCGYQWEDRDAKDCVRIGVSDGYSASTLLKNLDTTTVAAVVAFLLLVFCTGCLIIYNIFQISVSNDVRFYGMLKTIGTTPRQLRRIVRLQALYLSLVGIPLGCLLGYGVGVLLTPKVLSISAVSVTAHFSASPIIFVGSSLFALITVFLSCAHPARAAAKLTPVEALRYTEQTAGTRKKRTSRSATIPQLAFANLGRNRTKTILVILSLSLTVVLLDCVIAFVGGFDMEKYLSSQSAADFVVGTTEYFQSYGSGAGVSDETVAEICQNTQTASGGSVYDTEGDYFPVCWLDEGTVNSLIGVTGTTRHSLAQRDSLYGANLLLEGFDAPLLEKLTLFDGSLEPLLDPEQHAIAIAVEDDDFGNVTVVPAQVGDTLTVTYIDEANLYDTRTGELAEDTPEEYLEYRIEESHDVTYTVCALVKIPHAMSYRFSTLASVGAVITGDALKQDMGGEITRMLYVFDSSDATAEAEAEGWLADYTADDSLGLNYESKAQLREEFKGFQNMFLLVGGTLCFIVGLVGVLNFFNAILTGILTRRREFAMLQSVGMTGRQLKRLLTLEGVFYALGAGVLAILLATVLNPLLGKLLETLFWFFSYRFVLWTVLAMIPVFLLLGILLPLAVYHFTAKQSIVERLREAEA